MASRSATRREARGSDSDGCDPRGAPTRVPRAGRMGRDGVLPEMEAGLWPAELWPAVGRGPAARVTSPHHSSHGHDPLHRDSERHEFQCAVWNSIQQGVGGWAQAQDPILLGGCVWILSTSLA
jgi:hypothetical protein